VREVRLLPIVLVAVASLLVLKTMWLVTASGRAPKGPETVVAEPAPAAKPVEMAKQEGPDVAVTGSSHGKPAEPPPPPKPEPLQAPPGPNVTLPVTNVPTEPEQNSLSTGEKAVLQRLQERRQELEARARELEMREGLLKAAEDRLQARLQELKATEARITAATAEKDQTEKDRLKGLVVMYEAMKAKDAARIFDRLDVKLAVEVATQMNPRKFSEVLAQMSGEAAERLTVELANHDTKAPATALPKIEGKKS
jgi:flagellar motility protein MotE (MotC chaperone)